MDEVPAYLPSGAGPHLYLRVEKRGRTTRDVLRALAARARRARARRRLRGPEGPGRGHHAVALLPGREGPRPGRARRRPGSPSSRSRATRTSSAPATSARTASSLAVRGGDARARPRLRRRARRARPRRTSSARSGSAPRAATPRSGARCSRASAPPRPAARSRDRFLRRLSISAYQSELFNRWLAERLADGLFATALEGDVLKKLDTGGLFTCEDPAVDGPRVARFEVSPAGPMFGHKLRAAGGRGARRARSGCSRTRGSPSPTSRAAAARRRGRAARRGSASRSPSRRSRPATVTARASSCRRARTRRW